MQETIMQVTIAGLHVGDSATSMTEDMLTVKMEKSIPNVKYYVCSIHIVQGHMNNAAR